MSNESQRSNPGPPSQHCVSDESRGRGKPIDEADADNRDVSAQMLALGSAADTARASAKPVPKTCRHFRYHVPRAIADELCDADPEPCPICDAMPHRRSRTGSR